MQSKCLNPVAVEILVGVTITGLKAVHFNVDLSLRASIIGGLSGGLKYWIGPGLPGRRTR